MKEAKETRGGAHPEGMQRCILYRRKDPAGRLDAPDIVRWYTNAKAAGYNETEEDSFRPEGPAPVMVLKDACGRYYKLNEPEVEIRVEH